MWYFTWILGVGVALAFGIINVMWLEAEAGFGERDIPPQRGSDEILIPCDGGHPDAHRRRTRRGARRLAALRARIG